MSKSKITPQTEIILTNKSRSVLEKLKTKTDNKTNNKSDTKMNNKQISNNKSKTVLEKLKNKKQSVSKEEKKPMKPNTPNLKRQDIPLKPYKFNILKDEQVKSKNYKSNKKPKPKQPLRGHLFKNLV